MWSALRIAIKPTALAEVASRIDSGRGFACGLFIIPFSYVFCLAAGLIARDPVNTVGEFLTMTAAALPATLIATCLLFLPVWVIAFSVFVHVGRLLFIFKPKGKDYATLVALSPLTMLVPFQLWSVGAILHTMANAVVNKPPVLDSIVIKYWASPAWLLVMALSALAFAVHAARRFGEFPEDDETPICAFCSYNLTGNLSGMCPECGKTIISTQSD